MGIAGGVRDVIQAMCVSADAFGGGVDQVLRRIGIAITTSTIIERQLAMAVASLPPPIGADGRRILSPPEQPPYNGLTMPTALLPTGDVH
jgi:hypothetical protein